MHLSSLVIKLDIIERGKYLKFIQKSVSDIAEKLQIEYIWMDSIIKN